MVSESWRKWKPNGKVPAWNPFLLDEDSRNGDTQFEIDFVLGGEVLVYGFRFDSSSILEEWLMGSAGRKLYFRRWTKGTEVIIDSPRGNLASRVYLGELKRQTRANSLFLSAAAQGSHAFLSSVFQWIDDRFGLLSPGGLDGMPRSYSACCCTDDKQKQTIKTIMSAAGTGVVDLVVEEEDMSPEVQKMMDAIAEAAQGIAPAFADAVAKNQKSQQKITLVHEGRRGRHYPLPFELESTGTRAFFHLLGPVLEELRSGGLILIDEIESSMHPHLAEQIVRLFNSVETNPKGAQLVFVTHDVTLLDTKLLRRDQIWIAEKDAEGATEIVSVSDFGVRKEKDLSAAYLKGSFGGIPVIDEMRMHDAVVDILADDEAKVVAERTM